MGGVLIVDDHAGFRSVARALLEDRGIEVVGEAPDGVSALTLAARLRPRALLLDVHLPDLDGFAVAERLLAGPAPPSIVLTSTRAAPAYRARARAIGLTFVEKDRLSDAGVAALLA
jgi:CheY-like chemotaxis protein